MEAGHDKRGLRKLAGDLRARLGGVRYEWFVRLVVLRGIEAREAAVQRPRNGREALWRMRANAAAFPALFGKLQREMSRGAGERAVSGTLHILWDPERARQVDDLLTPAAAPGWMHQYWCEEDKQRVAAKLRLKQGDKIDGDDLVAATSIYTEAQHARLLVEHALVPQWGGASEKLQWRYSPGPTRGSRSARELTVFDPACGCGHLLLEAFDVLLAMQRAEEPRRPVAQLMRRILRKNLFGLDIDPRAVRLAQTALLLRCREHDPGFGACQMNIAVARSPLGSLRRPARRASGAEKWLRRRFDAVVTNPPFVGFRKLGAPVREYLAKQDPLATSDLAVAFISRCMELVRDGGRLAVVAPAAWLTSRPAMPLRRRILNQGGPVLVAFLGQRVFDTAPLLFASLAVIERGGRSKTMCVLTARGGNEPALREAAGHGGVLVSHASLRASAEARFSGAPIPATGSSTRWTTMGELFDFYDGVWSGDNARDVREASQVAPDDPEWVPASGGQGYRRWYAPIRRRIRAGFVADWPVLARRDGAIEYARVAGGKLAARLVCGRSAAIAGVVTCVPRGASRVADALAIFNTRVGTLWLRSLTSGLNFNPGYAAQIPLPREGIPVEARAAVERAVVLKRELARTEIGCDDWDEAWEADTACERLISLQRELIRRETEIEAIVAEWVGVSRRTLETVVLPIESALEKWVRSDTEGLHEKIAGLLATARKNRREVAATAADS